MGFDSHSHDSDMSEDESLSVTAPHATLVFYFYNIYLLEFPTIEKELCYYN